MEETYDIILTYLTKINISSWLLDQIGRAYAKQSDRGAARWVDIFDNFYKMLCMVFPPFSPFFLQTQR